MTAKLTLHHVHVRGMRIFNDGSEETVDESYKIRAATPEEAIEKAELRFGEKYVDVDEWTGFILVDVK